MSAEHASGGLDHRGLDFFGRVTASATHDIKNELAVINEQSHLVQELLEMAMQGRETDPARLGELIGRVIVRVGRADQAVKRLNAFAHSAERDKTACDVRQALDLVVRLFTRLAGLKGVTLEMAESSGSSLQLQAPPIVLEEAMWAALQAAVAAAVKGTRLGVELSGGAGSAVMLFRGSFDNRPQPPAAEVLEPLGATVSCGDDFLELTIPVTVA